MILGSRVFEPPSGFQQIGDKMKLNKKLSKLNKHLDKLLRKTRRKQGDKPNLSIWWILGAIFAGSVFVAQGVMIFMGL